MALSKSSFETLKGLNVNSVSRDEPESITPGHKIDLDIATVIEHQQLSMQSPRRQFLKQALIAGGAVAAASALKPMEAFAAKPAIAPNPEMKPNNGQVIVNTLAIKDFSNLYGNRIPGLSDNQLKQHIGLYEGYVKKTNELNDKISQLSATDYQAANGSYALVRELLVERSFVHNGAVLHELYFGNLGSKNEPSAGLKTLVSRDYGSWDNFMGQIVAAAKAMRGWAIIGFDMLDGKLRTYGLDTHNQCVPTMVHPLLVIDIYEHAYMIDFGTARAKYLDVMMANINWEAVNNRLLFAVHHLPSGPKATE